LTKNFSFYVEVVTGGSKMVGAWGLPKRPLRLGSALTVNEPSHSFFEINAIEISVNRKKQIFFDFLVSL